MYCVILWYKETAGERTSAAARTLRARVTTMGAR